MNLNIIFEKHRKEIIALSKPINLSKIKKDIGKEANLLIFGLINDLISYYEENNFKETICFQINKEIIYSKKNESFNDYNNNFFSSDLGIIIGRFELNNDNFIKDKSLKVFAQTASSCFYAELNPFRVIHNSINHCLRKCS